MALAFLTALATVVASTSAVNDRQAVRLDYSAPEVCPSRARFVALLAARLGYDPVSEPALRVAEVAVRLQRSHLKATFRISETGGLRPSERSFEAEEDECDALVSSVALALAIALDPRLLSRPVSAAPPEPVAPTESAPPLPPPRTPAQPEVGLSVGFSLGVGVRGSVGLLPTPGLGPGVEARVRVKSFSAALEGEAVLAPAYGAAGGTVEVSLTRAGLQACGHVAFVALCAHGTAGALAASGTGFDRNRRGWQPAGTVGPLVAATWQPVGGLLLQASLGLEVVLVRNSITAGTIELWNSPLLAGSLGVLVGWKFL